MKRIAATALLAVALASGVASADTTDATTSATTKSRTGFAKVGPTRICRSQRPDQVAEGELPEESKDRELREDAGNRQMEEDEHRPYERERVLCIRYRGSPALSPRACRST